MSDFDNASKVTAGVFLYGSAFGLFFMSDIDVSSVLLAFVSVSLIMIAYSIVLPNRHKATLITGHSDYIMIWLFALAMAILLLFDIALYWKGNLAGLFDIAAVRNTALNDVSYRSAIGKFAGLFYIPFICMSAVFYLLKKKYIYIVPALAVALVFSLFMGGRGPFIFFIIIYIPIFIHASKYKLFFYLFVFILIIAAIQSYRELWTISESLESVIQYSYEGWYGFYYLLNGNVDLYQFRIFEIYEPLDSYVFPIHNRTGNIYTGIGNGAYLFGWFGYVLYCLLIICIFKFCIEYVGNNIFWSLYYRCLLFVYVVFLPFHDLVIFYSSFDFALFFGLFSSTKKRHM